MTISVAGLREAIMNAVPLSLKRAIGVGIGLFMLFIGFQNGGLIGPGTPVVEFIFPNTTWAWLTLIGLLITVVLYVRKVPGALVISTLLFDRVYLTAAKLPMRTDHERPTMILDEAERIVDGSMEPGEVWRGALYPAVPGTPDPFRRDYARTEWVAERVDRALLRARVRFLHLTRRTSRERRGDGVWVSVVDTGPEQGEPETSEIIRVDLEVPVAELTEGLYTHHFGFPGMTLTREVATPDGEPHVVEWVSQSVQGTIELRADPQPGPHGVIRLLVRVRNTTEPLQKLENLDEARAFALVGCHAILALDKGKFIPIEDPPAFSARYVALCENEGTRPVIVDDLARILLSAPNQTLG